MRKPLEIAGLKAAAEKAGWGEADAKPRPAVGDTLRGRGISLMSGYNTYVAVIAEVEVDRRTGRVWPRRITVAHDCGLVINPSSLALTIEGNVLQPWIQGRAVKLHPLVVALAVAAGGALAGFLGVFLAVPVTAAGVVALSELRAAGVIGPEVAVSETT